MQAKQWHHFGCMTTKREKTKDYEFFFKSIATAVEKIIKKDYKPTCLVADAAGQITNGFMNAYSYESVSEFKRIVCYQHVRRNIDKHTHLMDKNDKINIKVKILIYMLRVIRYIC